MIEARLLGESTVGQDQQNPAWRRDESRNEMERWITGEDKSKQHDHWTSMQSSPLQTTGHEAAGFAVKRGDYGASP